MRTLLKLVIVGLVLHAVYRAGTAYMLKYTFQDQLRDLAQFGARTSEEALHDRAMEIASGLNVPIKPGQITVRHAPGHTYIDGAYQTQIELLPRYFRPWEFKVKVDVLTLDLSPGAAPVR